MKRTIYSLFFALVLGFVIWVVAVNLELPDWHSDQVLTADSLNTINSRIKEAVKDLNDEIEALKADVAEKALELQGGLQKIEELEDQIEELKGDLQLGEDKTNTLEKRVEILERNLCRDGVCSAD